MNELKELIDKHEIISFDIFDTLLLRPFMKPVDVFLYIEKLANVPSFYSARIAAEKIARIEAKNRQDITFKNIYEHIDEKYKNIEQLEKNFEKQILQANKEMLDIYNYAKSLNKKIIITSDMYYETEFLKPVLEEKGFKDFDNIYVSSEIGLTKHTGDLYKYIIEDLQVSPDKILHVGDNKLSDIQKAEENGINTYFYLQIKEKFIKDIENKRLIEFFTSNKDSLFVSLLLGLRIINWHNNKNNNYWQNFGYNYGGILIFSIVMSIIEITKERQLTNILFAARDGYPLVKAFNLLNTTNAKAYYVYASRKIRGLCLNDNYIGCCYNKTTEDDYEKYIKSFNLKDGDIAIVDSCAHDYSSQALLTKFMKKNILGIYFSSDLNYKYNYINLSGTLLCKIPYNWNLMELLLTSPELKIVGFKDQKPVYIDNSFPEYKIEELRQKIYIEIEKGEMQFISNISSILKEYLLPLPCDIINSYIDNFDKNLTALDIDNLSKIKHPIDANQQEYVSLAKTEKNDNTNQLLEKLREKVKARI